MAQSARVSTKLVFLFSLLLGAMGGFVFVDLAAQLHQILVNQPNLRQDWVLLIASCEPYLSHIAVGLICFGLTTYLLCRITIARFAGGLLHEMLRIMRA